MKFQSTFISIFIGMAIALFGIATIGCTEGAAPASHGSSEHSEDALHEGDAAHEHEHVGEHGEHDHDHDHDHEGEHSHDDDAEGHHAEDGDGHDHDAADHGEH